MRGLEGPNVTLFILVFPPPRHDGLENEGGRRKKEKEEGKNIPLPPPFSIV